MNLNEPYCFLLTIKAAVVRQSCQLFTQRHFWRRLPALHGTGQNLQLIHRHNLLSIKNSDGDAEFVTNGEYTAFIPMDDSFAQSSFGQCISYMSKVKKHGRLNLYVSIQHLWERTSNIFSIITAAMQQSTVQTVRHLNFFNKLSE